MGSGIAAAPPCSATIKHTHVISLRSCASSLVLPASVCSFQLIMSSTTQARCSSRAGTFCSSSPLRKKKGWTVAVGSKAQVEDDEACELVNGTEVTIGEGNGSVRAHLFHAVKNNNGTGILLLSDVLGFQDSSTRDFAYRTACNGYNVLVPDLFRGNPWRQEQPRSMFQQWLATQDAERVVEDVEACTKWMVAAGISSKLGVIGFCYGGGRVVEVLARDRGSCFGTGVSFYGTTIDPSAADHVEVPVLFITGDKDPLCPVEGLSELALKVGNGSELVVFNGRAQSFAHRPQSNEDDTDAEKAFLAMRNWLHHHLISSLP